VWDEENHLACNQDTATTVAQTPAGCTDATARYTYDATGQRVIKHGDGLHLYPNNTYSERDNTGFKHIFIGDSRIITKTVTTDGTPEDQQSYFHADHLDSSGYVTNKDGTVTEHLEYFAFGETWIQEQASQTTPTPYKYTGKEQDEETGLYYHGARYYNPRAQLWASTDPAIPEFIDGHTAAGGIGNPRNLATYTYNHNNPVQLTDPNGRSPRPAPTLPELLNKYGYIPEDPGGRLRPYFMDKFITKKEFNLLAVRPWRIGPWLEASQRAGNLADSYYGDGGDETSDGNAFQHVAWSAMLTLAFGPELAKKLTDAHEGGPNNDPMSQMTDQYNNELGRKIVEERGSNVSAETVLHAARYVVDHGSSIKIQVQPDGRKIFVWTGKPPTVDGDARA
jgi:RHS repeat-associated protein